MATVQTFRPQAGGEISRLLTAAVVNRGFRDLLLSSPARALEKGFNGEKFSLAQREKELILSIQAGSLSEFAQQLSSLQPISSHRPGARSRLRG